MDSMDAMDAMRLCHDSVAETRNVFDSADFEQYLRIPACALGCS
jgi:hypothetical protein